MNTIKENIEHEIIIKNSKFITKLIKIKTKEEIEEALRKAKLDYPKANHYCYAYKLENIKKSSDDGEPGGTAGMPMLNILEKEDITNVLAITIRYFGGIKLGAGGLVRAYAKSVKEAINQATIVELIPAIICNITFPYNKEKEIKQEVKEGNILSKTYLENITYQVKLSTTSPLLKEKQVEKIKETYIEKARYQ